MPKQNPIVQWLFSTQAIRVSPPDAPFWYTSGTLGPFYINTHFLYGGEAAANGLLEQIEACLTRPLELPAEIAAAVDRQYHADDIYRSVCDQVLNELRTIDCDFVSGGERRDFFFSLITARLLDKPHLTLFKNGEAVLSGPDGHLAHAVAPRELAGQKALHVADLVTEASSYQRAWLPAINRCGATMPFSLAIIDRNQGGREFLAAAGTQLITLATIDRPIFVAALDQGLINAGQFDQIERFQKDPRGYMARFIQEHPRFLDEQIALGGKSRERAVLFIEKFPDLARKV
jgi:hypothetical protein